MFLIILLLIIIIIIFYSYSSLSIISYFIYQDNNTTIDSNKLREYIDKNLTAQEKTYLTNLETKLNFSIINIALDPDNQMKKNNKDITQIINYINSDNTLTNEQKKEYIKNYMTSILFMRKSILDQYFNVLSSADKKILDDEMKTAIPIDQYKYIVSENIINASIEYSNIGMNNNISNPIINILIKLGDQLKKTNIQSSMMLARIYSVDVLQIQY